MPQILAEVSPKAATTKCPSGEKVEEDGISDGSVGEDEIWVEPCMVANRWPSIALQTLALESRLSVSMRRPSLENVTFVTSVLWSRKVVNRFPFSRFHKCTWSKEAVAMFRPSGEKATRKTVLLCWKT